MSTINVPFYPPRPAILFCLSVLLAACGGGSGGGGGGNDNDDNNGGDSSSSSAATDTAAPTAEILFPPARSLTEGDEITVRGTAADPEGSQITVVRVNGVDAASDDGFATWTATVPLERGDNTLTVETGDIATNADTDAAGVVIARQARMSELAGAAIDADNNRLLVADPTAGGVIAVDMDTRVRTPFSVNATVDPPYFQGARGIAIDSTANRALVTDASASSIIQVNLDDGTREPFSNDTLPNTGEPFDYPGEIVVDPAFSRALVVDEGLDAVVLVALSDGDRMVISDDDTPDTVNQFNAVSAIALDGERNRALVVDQGDEAVIAVQLSSGELGERVVLSNFGTPDEDTPFDTPVAIGVDADNDRALVVDMGDDRIVDVDLDTMPGVRTVLSDTDTDPDRPFTGFYGLEGIVMDPDNNRALALDTLLNAVMAVDLTDGTRSVFSYGGTPTIDHPLVEPEDVMVSDGESGRMFVVDRGLFAILEVDPDNGARTVLSDPDTPNGDHQFSAPVGLVEGPEGERLFVVDRLADAVFEVDIASGAREVLSDDDSVGLDFDNPVGLALDADNGRLLVVDTTHSAVIEVDLDSGARQILSGPIDPNDAAPLIDNPLGIVVDPANDRALVLDEGLEAVVAVALSDGSRSILSDSSKPDNNHTFSVPRAITLDAAGGRALVADAVKGVIAVALDDGARTIVSDPDAPDNANQAQNASGIAWDAGRGRVLVSDTTLRAVIAVDGETGRRVILSK